jgi:hypothetical protein
MSGGSAGAGTSGADRWLDRVLTRARVRRFSITILAVNVALYAAMVAKGRFPFDAQGAIVLPDFMAHLTGGVLLARGESSRLYDVAAQSAFQVGITGKPEIVDVFLSPPIAAFLYAPFAGLSYAGAAVAWTAVSLCLFVLASVIVVRLLPGLPVAEKRVFFIAFAASQPVIQLLGSGQDTALSLLLWSAGTWLALRRRDGLAGLVFSLGLFKPQLFVLPPLVFLLHRRRRALAAWVGGALALTGIALLVFGKAGFAGWWQLLHSPQYLVSLRSGRALRMASVVPLVLSIAPDGMGGAADAIGKAACVGIAAATVVRMVPRAGQRALDERGVWALACVATLLVTPHLFYYDLTLLALPAALLLDVTAAYSRQARNALLALTLLTWTGAARIPFESAPWPIRLLAASWTAVPMFVLWREIPTRVTARAETGASLRPSA